MRRTRLAGLPLPLVHKSRVAGPVGRIRAGLAKTPVLQMGCSHPIRGNRRPMMKNRRACLGLVAAMLMPVAPSAAPLPAQDPVYKAIAAADAALFGASNRCDLAAMGKLVDDNLEFYHDKSGLSVGKADLLQKTRDNICGKMVRELVASSFEVYPLPGYGAVELGTHRFLHPAEPNNIGQAKFIHVWRLQGGAWKLTRVLSFDH